MSRLTPRYEWSENEFKEWLILGGISSRVASNYISRCRRIENSLGIFLAEETKSEESFKNLMIEIQKYSNKISSTKVSAYSLTGSLRLAARKFAECFHGKKAFIYPSCHGLSQY